MFMTSELKMQLFHEGPLSSHFVKISMIAKVMTSNLIEDHKR